MYKIGLIGNASVGKTTSAFGLVRWLKLKGERVGYCVDAARFVTFPTDKFDIDPNARLFVLFQHIANECEQMVRNDIDYLVTERTAADWWMYYQWTCEHVGRSEAVGLSTFVMDWQLNSYDLLVFLDSQGMRYVNDGFRPASTMLRDEMGPRYEEMLGTLLQLASDKLIIIRGDVMEERDAMLQKYFEGWYKYHRP